MYPLVTIGIPFYNSSLFLNEAIQSVLNQTYCNWELILIDDGSTDNSLEIANLYKDSRIKVVSDGINIGLVWRLNQIINLANGHYLARMDSDDVMSTDRIEKQVNYLLKNRECQVIGSNYYVIDRTNKVIGERSELRILKTKADILKFGGLAHPTVMAHTTWFRKNLYDARFKRFEDLELWYRTIENSNFRILDDKLLFYRSVGIPTYKKYLQSNIGIQLFFTKELFQAGTPKFVIFIYLVKSGLKIILYSFLHILNAVDLVVLLRYQKIHEKDLEFAQSVFNQSLVE
jgi:glycosyltransferase involved in cell wall biosynthesis